MKTMGYLRFDYCVLTVPLVPGRFLRSVRTSTSAILSLESFE